MMIGLGNELVGDWESYFNSWWNLLASFHNFNFLVVFVMFQLVKKMRLSFLRKRDIGPMLKMGVGFRNFV
jgi:hypothetical protein